MLPFIESTWRAGRRGRSFQLVFVLGLFLIGGAYLSSLFSPRQPRTVALDVGLSGIGFTLIMLVLFWVQELVGREIERRGVVLTLAYPVSRGCYLLGRFCGIALLLLVATLMLGVLLLSIVLFAGGDYQASRLVQLGLPYWSTIAGLYLQALVVLAFALWIASLSTMVTLPMALGVLFAVAGRTLGTAMDYLFVRPDEADEAVLSHFSLPVKIVRWLLPDLSRLDWRDWSLYGVVPEIGVIIWSAVMAVAFCGILLVLAVLAFQRREFN